MLLRDFIVCAAVVNCLSVVWAHLTSFQVLQGLLEAIMMSRRDEEWTEKTRIVELSMWM